MNGLGPSADMVVAGAGPAGLAAALEAARNGLRVAVVERRASLPDKACGEGVLPEGEVALRRWGVRARIGSADCAPFRGFRLVQADGTFLEADFRRGQGLGVRRTALVTALAEEARSRGVRVVLGCALRRWTEHAAGVRVDTDGGTLEARLLVLATGLHSRVEPGRLRGPVPTRFGLRRHFRLRPWTDRVEVHFGDGVEAYVTPTGAERVGLAFLWDRSRLPQALFFDDLLRRFPALESRLGVAPPDSEVRGAGPLGRWPERTVTGRVLRIGDAAGAVDPIAGEGIALAFACATALGALAGRGAEDPSGLDAYQRAFERRFARADREARILLGLARRPWLRRGALSLARNSPACARAISWASAGAWEVAARDSGGART